MPSLERGETFASGMVRPKTTALFFDKLWVHPALIKGFKNDELEPYRVPAELCVTNPLYAAEYYDSWEKQRAYMASKWGEVAHTDVTEALRRLSLETWDLRSIFEIEAIQHFADMDTPVWKSLRDSLPKSPSGDGSDKDWTLYMSTNQRNKAIRLLVKIYEAKNITLTPIYLTQTEFHEGTSYESTGLEVCIDCIPAIVDSDLTWEQVFETRRDKEAVQKFNRLRRWFTTDLAKKSAVEIRAILEKKLDDYEYALRRHGIKTALAGATSVLSFVAGPAAVQLLTSSPLAAVAGGLVLASGAIAWIGQSLIERSDLNREEVAYIYDVKKLVAGTT